MQKYPNELCNASLEWLLMNCAVKLEVCPEGDIFYQPLQCAESMQETRGPIVANINRVIYTIHCRFDVFAYRNIWAK